MSDDEVTRSIRNGEVERICYRDICYFPKAKCWEVGMGAARYLWYEEGPFGHVPVEVRRKIIEAKARFGMFGPFPTEVNCEWTFVPAPGYRLESVTTGDIEHVWTFGSIGKPAIVLTIPKEKLHTFASPPVPQDIWNEYLIRSDLERAERLRNYSADTQLIKSSYTLEPTQWAAWKAVLLGLPTYWWRKWKNLDSFERSLIPLQVGLVFVGIGCILDLLAATIHLINLLRK